jgi:hypothetical protein
MILSLPEKGTIAEQIRRRKGPERFPAKWIPVRVKKTRQNKYPRCQG